MFIAFSFGSIICGRDDGRSEEPCLTSRVTFWFRGIVVALVQYAFETPTSTVEATTPDKVLPAFDGMQIDVTEGRVLG